MAGLVPAICPPTALRPTPIAAPMITSRAHRPHGGRITGIAAADFSRIRRIRLNRFTVDRLMTTLNRLGQEVDVDVHFRARPQQAMHPFPAR